MTASLGDPLEPSRPISTVETLRRLLLGGRNIRELRRILAAGELEPRPGLRLRVLERPDLGRAIIPTVRLLQVKFAYDDPTDPANEAIIIYTFTSAETVDENLDGLVEFITGGPAGAPGGPGGPDRPVEPRSPAGSPVIDEDRELVLAEEEGEEDEGLAMT